MASAEEQTKTLLTGAAGLLALLPSVGDKQPIDRIFPDEIPEDCLIEDGPAVAFERIDSQPNYTLVGELHSAKVQIAVTAWAKTRAAANAVALQVETAMAQEQNEKVSQGSAYQEELDQYASILAFDVWELD
jgi:hypothetical protein